VFKLYRTTSRKREKTTSLLLSAATRRRCNYFRQTPVQIHSRVYVRDNGEEATQVRIITSAVSLMGYVRVFLTLRACLQTPVPVVIVDVSTHIVFQLKIISFRTRVIARTNIPLNDMYRFRRLNRRQRPKYERHVLHFVPF